jgi:hypothetical protein
MGGSSLHFKRPAPNLKFNWTIGNGSFSYVVLEVVGCVNFEYGNVLGSY